MALELQAAWGETMHVGLHPWAPWTMACPPTRSWDFRQVQDLPATSGCPIAANQEAWLLPQQLLDLCKQQQGVSRKTSHLNRLPWDTKGGSAAAAWWAICPAGWAALQGWLQEDQEVSVYMYVSRLQREEIRCHRGQLALSFNWGKGRLPLKKHPCLYTYCGPIFSSLPALLYQMWTSHGCRASQFSKVSQQIISLWGKWRTKWRTKTPVNRDLCGIIEKGLGGTTKDQCRKWMTQQP